MEKALVICPGRGTYTASELGYLKKHGQGAQHLIDQIDAARNQAGQISVSELDQATQFSAQLHTPGENAAALIYACSLSDFQAIDQEKYEVVAITGNSMGWYTALGLGAALTAQDAFALVNTMGSMMKDEVLGGQIVYPQFDDRWQPDEEKKSLIDARMEAINHMNGCEVYDSIYLGGYRVIGGNEQGLKQLMKTLPKLEGRFPLRLLNHAAFHTPMMADISKKAFELIPKTLFQKPRVPLIDGRGHIWQPYSTQAQALWRYTLGHQVLEPYDFTQAITVGLKEFAPTKLILLGPGSSLGGAMGQTMIQHQWNALNSKAQFLSDQEKDPYLLAMGRDDQRHWVESANSHE